MTCQVAAKQVYEKMLIPRTLTRKVEQNLCRKFGMFATKLKNMFNHETVHAQNTFKDFSTDLISFRRSKSQRIK